MTTFFSKYEGAGNDFILIDDRSVSFPLDPSLIQQLCHRQKGIGADGVILLQPPRNPAAHFRMRIFNSDASEASMCGNGLRCLVRFIQDLGMPQLHFQIESEHSLHRCEVQEAGILIDLGSVEEVHWGLSFLGMTTYLVHTGVPHLVTFVNELETLDVAGLGRELRYFPQFAPAGVNVNFAQLLEDNQIALRTYERGVEAETLACGTGAAAVGYVASKLQGKAGPFSLKTRSGESLEVVLDRASVALSGPARLVFEGRR